MDLLHVLQGVVYYSLTDHLMHALSSITCPHCNKSFEPSDALQHAISEEILAKEREKQQQELEKIRLETERKTAEKLAKEHDLLISELKKDSAEAKERNRELIKELANLSQELRDLKRKDEEREFAMQKKITEETEKIKEEVRIKTLAEHELKDLEKDKMLSDARKQVEELKKKIEQGSQQTQGEVLELKLEELLRHEFPLDHIAEVKKGQRGADILQAVIDKNGKNCGTILWESKNAQWSEGWIAKLKEDQRAAKANLSVLAVVNGPQGLTSYMHRDGVWICEVKMVKFLALALRYALVGITHEKTIHEGKKEKMEILYSYITSLDFKARIESIIESFNVLQDDLEKEKRYFQTKWARQEKQLRKVLDHTHGMYGDLQGVIGKSLPDMEALSEEGEEVPIKLPTTDGITKQQLPMLGDTIQ